MLIGVIKHCLWCGKDVYIRVKDGNNCPDCKHEIGSKPIPKDEGSIINMDVIDGNFTYVQVQEMIKNGAAIPVKRPDLFKSKLGNHKRGMK